MRHKPNNIEQNWLKGRDISESLGKLPPQALDLEEAVLGGALFERQGQIVLLEKLTKDDFYKESHALIFEAMSILAQNGQPIDLRSVKNQLAKTGHLELIGGAYVLAELSSKVSQSSSTEHYCHILIEKRIARDLINLASMLHYEAYEDTTDVFSLVQKVASWPVQLMDKIKSGTERAIKDGVNALGLAISERKDTMPEITGMPSGYANLDKLTSGFQPGNLVIIAARPSMGKTTLAINMGRNAAIDFKSPVGIFSLEMSYDELVKKFVSMESDISLKKLTSELFTPLDWDQYMYKTKALAESPIYIDDTGSLSIMDLRIRSRRLVEKYGVKEIIVDYIQLMKGEPHTLKNREQEISSITRGLKAIAKELKIPVIALSQLSRDVEKRPSPFLPKLADLRESGSIEQDADIVIFPYRPAYYKISGDANGTFIDGLTKLIIAKHRNGALGEPCISAKLSTSRFVSIDSPYAHAASPFERKEVKADVVESMFPTNSIDDDEDMPF